MRAGVEGRVDGVGEVLGLLLSVEMEMEMELSKRAYTPGAWAGE